MKNIVCYGDSNTFGFNSKDGSRYDENTRWTAVLQNILGSEYKVYNEGMCDRTGFVNNPNGEIFSAQEHFPKTIESFENIDTLILWIGTNDLMFQYNISDEKIEKGLQNLIRLAQLKTEKIIVIPPVILREKILGSYFGDRFDKTSIAKSKDVQNIYKTVANTYHCRFFDINEIVKPSDFDGLHYDEISHRIIAEELAQLV